mmetsp:Transcript_846/g.952  ORF Transcript_846/g.952 Transcript_846/m.952 type:complete len:330 (+) Transcript_846:57-1046(+)
MAQYADPPYEVTPLQWSAGLIFHPQCVKDTLEYFYGKDLKKSRSLWPLIFIPKFLAKILSKYYFHFSAGQSYADVVLNVFKRSGGLCLTSFERFSHGTAGYQQLPWMANIGGVGVWSQSGSDRFTNTHSPYVSQRGGLLTAAYVSPPILSPACCYGGKSCIGAILGTDSRVFWPEGAGLFDEIIYDDIIKIHDESFGCKGGDSRIIPSGQWWMGRRGEAMIGLMCTQRSYRDDSKSSDALIQASPEVARIHIPRRVCKELQCSWIIYVDTTRTFKSLRTMLEYCRTIKYNERLGNKSEVYQIKVRGDGRSQSTMTDPLKDIEIEIRLNS